MHIFSIDLGGTAVKYAVVETINGTYSIKESGSFPTPYQGADYLISQLADLVNCHRSSFPLSGIAISTPGSVSGKDGIIFRGGKLRYLDQVPMGYLISNATSLPCTVENDGHCGLIGEYIAGALKGCSYGAMIVIGTSIGGGIVLNGKILTGAHNFAGKFAHLITFPTTDTNNYSYFGVDNGRDGLASLVRRHTNLSEEEPLTGYQIFDMAESGNQKVLSALRKYCHMLAIQLCNIQITIDPEIIAIGGGISSRTILLNILKEELFSLCHSFPIKRPVPNICLALLGNDANLIGASKVWSERNNFS